jgi:Carboxypeptidase regulatory-like domain
MQLVPWLMLAPLMHAGIGLGDTPSLFGVLGVVLSVEGAPVPDAEVRLVLDGPGSRSVASTSRSDRNGRFHAPGRILTEAASGRGWRLEVTAPGCATSVVDELFPGFGTYDVGPIYVFPPAAVVGRVTDETGRPIPGATVHGAHGDADWSAQGYDGASAARVLALPDGTYDLRALPPGRVTLGVSAPGFEDGVIHGVTLSADGAMRVDFTLEAATLLEGRVVGEDGGPIVGAEIEVEAGAFWRSPALSDEEGLFVVSGLPADWSGPWTVARRGFVPAVLFGRGPAREGPVVLAMSGQLHIKVQSSEAERCPPVTSVSLQLCAPQTPAQCGFCAELGWVKIPSELGVLERRGEREWGLYWQAAVAQVAGPTHGHEGPPAAVRIGLADGSSFELDRDPTWSAELVRVAITVSATGTIRGRVLRADDEDPVAGAVVILNRWSAFGTPMAVLTDGGGRFVFESVAPGDLHDLVVDDPSWRGRSGLNEVRSGEAIEVVLPVAPPPRIQGLISVDGAPPDGPLVVGLGELQEQHVVDGGWFGLGISDSEGFYTVIPKYSRRLTVVPKRRVGPEDGGYRRFRSEFPRTSRAWPWTVAVPERGDSWLDLELSDD